MRKRTRNSFSYGSMWMSLAPFWIADISIRFTSRMTGASPPCFSSEATSISSSLLEHLDVVVGDVAAVSSSARVTMSSVAALLRFAACAWSASRFFGSARLRGVRRLAG